MEQLKFEKNIKDGYYLSAYINLSQLGNIYIMGHRHDDNIALWKVTGNHVELLHYWELERLTGYKHHRASFFDEQHFIGCVNLLIRDYGITYEDLNEVWGVPKLNPSDKYLPKYRYPEFAYHGMSHLSAALFSDMDLFKNEKIIGFAIDGGTDYAIDEYRKDPSEKREREKNEFVAVYCDKGVIKEIRPAISPAVLWGVVSVYYGMEEGSLMALAGATTSEYLLEVEDFEYDSNLSKKPEVTEATIRFLQEIDHLTDQDIGVKFNGYDERFSERENKISMVMKVVQKMSERIMCKAIDAMIKDCGINPKETYFVMSGGYALNCPCNTYLMNHYGFKGFNSVPCVNDSGLSLGIGLFAFYNQMGADFTFKFENAYYGNQYDLNSFLEKGEFKNYIESVDSFDADIAAKDIEDGLVVWFDGRAEVGPRALGNRSILGDPRFEHTKDELNRVKHRQWWRPVAPIVLYERMGDWFEQTMESPYMLQAIRVREDKEDLVPAIVHIDHSSRVQTMKETDSFLLREVISAFEKRTNVPIICNTSLNDRGEPIINTIEEAMNFALRKRINIIYVNGFRIVLKNMDQYECDTPRVREFPMHVWKTKEERDLLVKQYNPENFSVQDICLCVIYVNCGLGAASRDGLQYARESTKMVLANAMLKKQLAILVYQSIKDINAKLPENNNQQVSK